MYSKAPFDGPQPGAELKIRGGSSREDSSKGLATMFAQIVGVAVTVGSFTLKVPQLTKCISASSVAGLSLYGAYFELNNFLGAAIYHYLQGYPLSTWAENLSLIAQQVAIIGLLWTLSVTTPTIGHMTSFFVAEALFIGGDLVYCLWISSFGNPL